MERLLYDTLVAAERAPQVRPGAYQNDLPPAAPLDMPVQTFAAAPLSVRWRLGWRAALLVVVTVLATGFAVRALYDVLAADTFGLLDFLVLGVFAPLFAWTAFSFASALSGLWAMWRDRDDLGLSGPVPDLVKRTAVLSPIYNESPDDLAARLQAMWRSLDAAGASEAFDFFILSDTTREDIQRQEYACYQALRRRLPRRARVFYRHRLLNIDRKAGNIADWVRTFGAAYDFMIILDADSLMEGQTLVRLAGAMERNPRLGILQTTPVVINRHSLFARTEQFASRLYGPILARGMAWWAGDQGNYWGHNAIIRVRAFARTAGLPHLSGMRPFGGHILSHDFVEAALMRRAGWEIRLAAGLTGSYEESPPTLADAITRDRRWCQGNLQHLKVIGARGFAPLSRLHLARGVSSYLTAPLWLLLLVASALLALKPEWGVEDVERADFAQLAPSSSHTPIIFVFAISMAFLLAPKAIAFLAMLASREERRLFGGPWKALAGMALEITLSGLVAPVLMLNQVWALISIVAGQDSGWRAQHREEGDLSLDEAANQHLGDTAVGIGLAVSALGVSLQTFLWMLPVILGMVFCIPFAALSARRDLGEFARRYGLLVTPEEVDPPAVVRAFNALRGHAAAELPAAPPLLVLAHAAEA
jgi:membrane glycosyltransferase